MHTYVDCLYRIDVKSCLIVFIGFDMAMANCARNALKVHLLTNQKYGVVQQFYFTRQTAASVFFNPTDGAHILPPWRV